MRDYIVYLNDIMIIRTQPVACAAGLIYVIFFNQMKIGAGLKVILKK